MSTHLTPKEKRLSARYLQRARILTFFLPVAFAVGLGVGYLLLGRTASATAAKAPQNNAAQNAADQQTKRYDVSEDDDPAFGPKNAPITIIEFSDYQCPYCRKWYVETFAKLMSTYPNQIRFIYRDFPLTSIHPEAAPAAIAAECANDQGKYWEFHDRLFTGEYGMNSTAYVQYATDLGLNKDKFQACLSNTSYANEVQGDLQYASSIGVRSTPTFFINGIALIGAQPFEAFQQVIDSELAAANP